LDAAMGEAGWTGSSWASGAAYDRPAPAPFLLRVQFWLDGEPVVVQALLTMLSEAVDTALEDLGEEDVVAWVTRDPLPADVTIERLDEVEAVVADVGAAAGRMLVYADVDRFVEAIETDDDTREYAALVVPVVLAVAARRGEARERARLAPGDFAERLDRWLAGERSPPPPGSEDTFSWGDALKASLKKARAVTPEERAERPQMSWRDIGRTGQTLGRLLRGELPPSTVFPERERAWVTVELGPDVAPVLERAREQSSLAILQDALIEARVEPAEAGRRRVLVDAVHVGWVPASEGVDAATVPARLQRTRRDGPLSLAVQLPSS
jgi:hypothetical protein